MPDLEPNWRDSLPDEIKGDPSLANFEDVATMAKSYVDLKQYQGESLRIPGEDAGEEQISEFNTKLMDKVPNLMLRPVDKDQTRDFYKLAGMPENANDYEAPKIEGLPEGMKADDSRLVFFKKIAHDAGLSKDQFSMMMKAVVEQDMSQISSNSDKQKSEMDALNKEWGVAANERNKQVKAIAERTKAPQGMLDALEKDALPADFVAWVYGLSISIGGEGNAHNDNVHSNNSQLTPAEAQVKINEIYDNPKHPFHRGDQTALKYMLDLVHLKDPTASTDPNDLRKNPVFG